MLGSVADTAAAVATGGVAAREVVDAALAAADAHDATFGVFLDRYADQARAAADEVDRGRAAGEPLGPLAGVPIGIKDIIACREGPTSAQSLVSDPRWWRGRDAPVVARLRAAGAIVVGKTTTSEHACAPPDPDKPFPPPRNPWDAERWAGGSSSGSASGVALGAFAGGVGTDTAGSIRLPSSFCGVTGLKPTYGAVSREGVLPLGFTLDHVGPMAATAADCRALFDVMAGPPSQAPMRVASLDGLRIGVDFPNHFTGYGAPEVEPVFRAALAAMVEHGAVPVEVDLPRYRLVKQLTNYLWMAEAFSVHAPQLASRWTDYGQPTRLSLAVGAFVDAGTYVKLQRIRRLAQRELDALFGEVDVIATPTSSVGAITLFSAELATIIDAIHTPYWDSMGTPVVSVPMGFTSDGLPLGMQIAGRSGSDRQVLDVASRFQEATTWHLHRPPARNQDSTGQDRTEGRTA